MNLKLENMKKVKSNSNIFDTHQDYKTHSNLITHQDYKTHSNLIIFLFSFCIYFIFNHNDIKLIDNIKDDFILPLKYYSYNNNLILYNPVTIYTYFTKANYPIRFIYNKKFPIRYKHSGNLPENDEIYHKTAQLTTELMKNNISVSLYSGSILGAKRHHNIIPIKEKDIDLAVFSTDNNKIENSLRNANLTWDYTSFGYHVNLPGTDIYIDLWLYEFVENNKKVTCVGNSETEGCGGWYKDLRYVGYDVNCSHSDVEKEKDNFGLRDDFGGCHPPKYPESWFFPFVLAPFGPYMMPIPKQSNKYLDLTYPKWNKTCGGYRFGDQDCESYYTEHPFVFTEQINYFTKIELLKQQDQVIQKFTIINNIYSSLEKPKAAKMISSSKI